MIGPSGSVRVLVAARPVWFAAAVPAAERELVLAAHRGAQRLAHRLLLILLPDPPAEAAALAAALEVAGWTVALRSDDQEPEPETEIYVVDSPAEIGLWYRLASIAFLGGSLAGQGAVRNPHEAAALGSAILYGPRAGAYAEMLGRLGAARGARAVASAKDLEEAVSDLLSPDRAARLAHAAWTVSTARAEVTEAVLARLRELVAGAS